MKQASCTTKKDDKMGGDVARVGEMINPYVLVGKPKGNRPLGLPRCRLQNIIKMGHKEIQCDLRGLNSCGSG